MAAAAAPAATVEEVAGAELQFHDAAFVDLLRKLIAETPRLMNRPPDFVPEENLAGRHILAVLEPFTEQRGGPLRVRTHEYVAGRGNITIEYPGSGSATCAFVGSHLDVVHADPKKWRRDPFTLTVEGDELHGRGTTDCLGHCALLALLFAELARTRPTLKVSVIGVIIADEEVGGSVHRIGVDGLLHHGVLDQLRIKNGPVYWLDCADKQPNIGSGGIVTWELTARGKTGHSGFPNKCVNAVELAYEAVSEIQRRFYRDFPKHPREAEYGFPCSSSLKPTHVLVPQGSLNQIKGECTISGDIRLVPFYKIKDAKRHVDEYVEQLNRERFASLPTRGQSKYHLESLQGADQSRIELKWLGSGMDGIACDLGSPGFKALAAATERIVGKVAPLADTGSLPLVADLQAAGYDVQTIGYGVEDAYHADDEFARLSDFQQGFRVLCSVVSALDRTAA